MKHILFLFISVSTALAHAQTELINAEQLFLDLKVLSSDEMQGRKMGTAGNKKAREYIKSRYDEIGLQYLNSDSFELPFSDGSKGVNVAGVIPGRTDQYIVLTAHFDHLGQAGNSIYNGADDNASGVASLMALAAHFVLNPPQHNLIFLALDGEERGLLGAYDFVRNPPVALESILLNLNMDMVAQNNDNELYVVGAHRDHDLKALMQGLLNEVEVDFRFGHYEWESQSDHYAFYKKGIPYLYFGVEDHKHYHRPSDTYESIPLDFFHRSVGSLLRVAREVDQVL